MRSPAVAAVPSSKTAASVPRLPPLRPASARGPVSVKVAQTEVFIPERKYLDGEPDHVWRNGKPDYTVVNQTYLAGKTRDWAAGSLESLVEAGDGDCRGRGTGTARSVGRDVIRARRRQPRSQCP